MRGIPHDCRSGGIDAKLDGPDECEIVVGFLGPFFLSSDEP